MADPPTPVPSAHPSTAFPLHRDTSYKSSSATPSVLHHTPFSLSLFLSVSLSLSLSLCLCLCLSLSLFSTTPSVIQHSVMYHSKMSDHLPLLEQSAIATPLSHFLCPPHSVAPHVAFFASSFFLFIFLHQVWWDRCQAKMIGHFTHLF